MALLEGLEMQGSERRRAHSKKPHMELFCNGAGPITRMPWSGRNLVYQTSFSGTSCGLSLGRERSEKQSSPNLSDAAFLLGVGSFLFTAELFFPTVMSGSFLLTI